MLGYVRPNIMIKMLHDLCKILVNVSIRQNWQNFINLANSSKSNQWEHDSFDLFPIENATYEFEQILEKDPTHNILMQNIFIPKQIIDDDNQSITIVLGLKGFQPLGLFHDIHFEEYNFPTLIFWVCKTIINMFILKDNINIIN
jgi:hypothetical protein